MKKKMKRYGGARQFFHHLFWGAAALIGFSSLPGTIRILGDGGGAFIPFAISVLLIFLGISNIVKYIKAKRLQRAQLPAEEQKPKGSIFLVPVYLILAGLSVSAAYTFFRGISIERWDDGTKLFLLGIIAIALFGLLMIWALTARIRHIGFYNYWATYKCFFVDYVPAFMIYQVSFVLISFLCNSIVLLASQSFGEASLIVSGFFSFVSEEDASGGVSGFALSAISGLTGASSYFVLSTFAQESLKAEKRLSLAERVKRMLHDSDTRKLLIMTVLCLAVGFTSGSYKGTLAYCFSTGCYILWAVSMLLFLKDTKLLWYCMNYSMMLFMEYAVPSPEIVGFGSAALSVLALAVRILLFSFVAMLIGYEFWLQERREEMIAADPSLNNGLQKANKTLFNASILDAGVFSALLVLNRKEIARDTAEMLKEAAIEKITGSKKEK